MKPFKHPAAKLLQIRGRQRLLSIEEVRAQVARHRADRLAANEAPQLGSLARAVTVDQTIFGGEKDAAWPS